MAKNWKRLPPFEGSQKIKYDNLLKHFSRYKNNIFVETGTHHGNGLYTALLSGYKKCYSIEIQSDLYSKALERFENEIQKNIVSLVLGNSEIEFKKIVDAIDEQATFWLDAHLSKNYGEKLAKNCPTIEELETIKTHHIKTHTILIDDLTCFGKKTHDNIALIEVTDKILEINNKYKFDYLDTDRKKDVLVAYIDE